MDEPTYVEGFHNKDEVIKMTYRPLGNTGLRLSHMSLGGGPLGSIYENIDEEEAMALVHEAIKNGINYIDTAPFYGQGKSEHFIGKALKSIPRKAYYIGTKIGRYEKEGAGMFDFSAEKIKKSFQESLKLLGLPYVDILQVHDVEFAENLDQVINETLPAVQEIVNNGQARFIGITGYPLRILKYVVEKSTVKIDSVLSYARNTLIDDELENYIPFFKDRGIGVIDAANVAMGMLTHSPGPQHWHPASNEIKEAVLKAIRYCKERDMNIAQLAVQHSKFIEGVTTHVLGSGQLEVFRRNWIFFTTEPTEDQKQVTKFIIEKFFVPLTTRNWEETAMQQYQQMKLKK